MEKDAVKVPFIHGTSGSWPLLEPGVGEPVLGNDPNPRAVYTAMDNRARARQLGSFAQKAVDARGGVPTLAKGKMDTAQGWRPENLSDFGRKHIGTIDEARDLVQELDRGAQEPRRGEIWRLLQKGTGAWRNENPAAALRATEHEILPTLARLKSAYDAGACAALQLFTA